MLQYQSMASWDEDRLVVKMTPVEGKAHPVKITRHLNNKELTLVRKTGVLVF